MAQHGFQGVPGLLHLAVEVGPVQTGELHVVKGVDADLVALLIHAAHHVLVVFNLGPDEEEGGLHPPLRQAVQQAGGGGAAGPVVEGEGDELLPLRQLRGRVRLHRRAAAGQGENQRQRGRRQPPQLSI